MAVKQRSPRVGVLAICLIVLAQSTQLQAQEAAAPSRLERFTNGLNPLNWRVPSFRTATSNQDKLPASRASEPSFFDQVSAGASKGWGKTKEILNPARYNPMKLFPDAGRSKSHRVDRDEPGFWRSWWTPEPRPREVNSVNDFLRQDRPKL